MKHILFGSCIMMLFCLGTGCNSGYKEMQERRGLMMPKQNELPRNRKHMKNKKYKPKKIKSNKR